MPQDLSIFMAKVKLSQSYIRTSNATIEVLEDIKAKIVMATQATEQSNTYTLTNHFTLIRNDKRL